MKKSRSKPLLVASAGAATIVFACGKPKPMRIGPTPPLPTPVPEEIVYTATVAPTATPVSTPAMVPTAWPEPTMLPIHIGPPTDPIQVPVRAGGYLDLASNRTARIFVDGDEVGMAPATRLYIEGGTHVVRVVDVKTGAAIEFRVDMKSQGYLRRKVVFPE